MYRRYEASPTKVTRGFTHSNYLQIYYQNTLRECKEDLKTTKNSGSCLVSSRKNICITNATARNQYISSMKPIAIPIDQIPKHRLRSIPPVKIGSKADL